LKISFVDVYGMGNDVFSDKREMISQLAIPLLGEKIAWLRCTRRSQAVKVPVLSSGVDAGRTTSASEALAVMKKSTTSLNSAAASHFPAEAEASGFSPNMTRALILPLSSRYFRSIALKILSNGISHIFCNRLMAGSPLRTAPGR